jgi:hypothetical protein
LQIANATPYKVKYGQGDKAWNDIADALNNNPLFFRHIVDSKGVRAKFSLLVSQFRKEEWESLKKSGTDEEYNELQQLLTDIVADMDDHTDVKQEEKSAENAKRQRLIDDGHALRQEAMRGLSRSTNVELGEVCIHVMSCFTLVPYFINGFVYYM